MPNLPGDFEKTKTSYHVNVQPVREANEPARPTPPGIGVIIDNVKVGALDAARWVGIGAIVGIMTTVEGVSAIQAMIKKKTAPEKPNLH